MNRYRSLRIRFAAWTAGAILVVLVLFGAMIYFGLQEGIQSTIDDSLRLIASQSVSAVSVENGKVDFSETILNPKDTNHSFQFQDGTVRILSFSGSVLQTSGPYSNVSVNLNSIQMAKSNGTFYETILLPGIDPVRVYTAPVVINKQQVAVIQVLESMDALSDTLENLVRIFLFSLPVLLVIAALSGYSLASSALAPIEYIINTARKISASDLSARLKMNKADDEVRRLADTLDQMLDRLEDAFLRERQFTADASHELRTPLTATRTILNVTRASRRSADEYEQALDDIAEETGRLNDLTEDLLMIARGQAQRIGFVETVNLSELLDDVCDTMLPIAESHGLGFEWDIQPGLFLKGDIDALIRLFNNLIDNAIKYTESGKIQVRAAREPDGRQCITIADTGKGIPPEHIPHIFQRFYRVEPSRTTPGSGLGLAIVKEIVQVHHGSVEVTSQIGVGTQFTLHFPEQST